MSPKCQLSEMSNFKMVRGCKPLKPYTVLHHATWDPHHHTTCSSLPCCTVLVFIHHMWSSAPQATLRHSQEQEQEVGVGGQGWQQQEQWGKWHPNWELGGTLTQVNPSATSCNLQATSCIALAYILNEDASLLYHMDNSTCSRLIVCSTFCTAYQLTAI